MKPRRRVVLCAVAHRAVATHVCAGESHGLLALCSHHAGAHAAKRGHQVATLERARQGHTRVRRLARAAARRAALQLDE